MSRKVSLKKFRALGIITGMIPASASVALVGASDVNTMSIAWHVEMEEHNTNPGPCCFTYLVHLTVKRYYAVCSNLASATPALHPVVDPFHVELFH
jgi:hypothetical protein